MLPLLYLSILTGDIHTWDMEVLTFNVQIMIGFLVLVLAAGVAIFIFCFW